MLDIADSSEPKLANDPTDSADTAEPMLPMLRTDPTEPIDSSELVDPIDSTELRDATLHREVSGTGRLIRPCCQPEGSDDRSMDVTREDMLVVYDTTIVSILHPELGWVDPALVALERGHGAVVITAWNPGLERPSEDDNRRANERLLREIQALGYEVWRADGRAPDGRFVEEGWIAWRMTVADGLALAARFDQFAIYTYDDSGMRVTVECPQ